MPRSEANIENIVGGITDNQFTELAWVLERCDDADPRSSSTTLGHLPRFRIRSLRDNRFLRIKGAGAHAGMPSEYISGVYQLPRFSRTRPTGADIMLDVERFLPKGAMEDAERQLRNRSSTIHAYNNTADSRWLFDVTGYLFESDFMLSHGVARAATRSDDDGGGYVSDGDFDAEGGVGFFAPRAAEVGNLPVRDFERRPPRTITRRLADLEMNDAEGGVPNGGSTFNRQLFRHAHASTLHAYCRASPSPATTRRGGFVADDETSHSPHDGRLDRRQCDALNRRTFQRWALGFPTHAYLGFKGDVAYAAGNRDCVAINILTGAHCELYRDDGTVFCLRGTDVQFGEWITLPCSHRKPFVCARRGASFAKEHNRVFDSPLSYDDARETCLALGDDYDLRSPPRSIGENTLLASLLYDALCDRLRLYGSDDGGVRCDLAASTVGEARMRTLIRADEHRYETLAGGEYDSRLKRWRNCSTTASFVRAVVGGTSTIVDNEVGRYGETGACERETAGIFRRHGELVNPSSFGEQDALTSRGLLFADVWFGMRRVDHFEGFAEQAWGKCASSESDDARGFSDTMLFRYVSCKRSDNTLVPNQYAMFATDELGRDVPVMTQVASHPFALDNAHRDENIAAYTAAVRRGMTPLADDVDLSALATFESEGMEALYANVPEYPLRPRVWRRNAIALKAYDARTDESVKRLSAGECESSSSSLRPAVRSINLATCGGGVVGGDAACGLLSLRVPVRVSTAMRLQPVTGEGVEDLYQTIFDDVLQRPRLRYARSYSPREMLAVDAAAASKTSRYVSRRPASLLNADSLHDPGEHTHGTTYGRSGIASGPDGVFGGGHGGIDLRRYLRSLDNVTYPCDSTREYPMTYSEEMCRSVDEEDAAPRIREVITPSSCGEDAAHADRVRFWWYQRVWRARSLAKSQRQRSSKSP
ncbi:hypothetical protein CYMTET_2784 [Cymbomonas tetramitiformis]|uniref:Uncharacterized protein n=1 Tax=Cymbomonas tetramitiformis TaxID=36881 RepID=A0AAE0H507_9CHLO|nr:hypothetical protein CYMTET_2784 [Cymbomonas tetramitiformis]